MFLWLIPSEKKSNRAKNDKMSASNDTFQVGASLKKWCRRWSALINKIFGFGEILRYFLWYKKCLLGFALPCTAWLGSRFAWWLKDVQYWYQYLLVKLSKMKRYRAVDSPSIFYFGLNHKTHGIIAIWKKKNACSFFCYKMYHSLL